MKLIEKFQAVLFPQDHQVEHYCGDMLAAVEPAGATETVCRIYQQKPESLAQRGPEQRPARLLIKNYSLAFPIFNTLNVCRSCVNGPVVRPTSKLIKVK